MTPMIRPYHAKRCSCLMNAQVIPDNQVTSTGLKALPTLKYPQNYPDVSITRFSFNVYLHIDLETVSS